MKFQFNCSSRFGTAFKKSVTFFQIVTCKVVWVSQDLLKSTYYMSFKWHLWKDKDILNASMHSAPSGPISLSLAIWHFCSQVIISSTSYRSIITDPSKEGLMHLRIVNCPEMFTWKFCPTVITSIRTVSVIQWNDRISHPCNLIGPLNCSKRAKVYD